MNPTFLKQEAKQCVNGNRFVLLKPYLIIWIISYMISGIFTFIAMGQIGFDTLASFELEAAVDMISNSLTMTISSLLTTFITSPLTYGLILYYNQFEKEHYADLNIVFSRFSNIIKIFVITMFINVLVTIGCMFLLVPGIVLACAFGIIPYVYSKHPELGIMDMISLAWKMMNGHKMEYLMLELSFFGWYLLGAFTCGIALLWLLPYQQMTMVKYFNSIYDSYNNIAYTV